jgi:serine/threonine protein kinase
MTAHNQLGGYNVGRVVAGGTYATLYAVQDRDSLLIKVLPEHLIDEASFKNRFENYFELIVQLQHPNLLQPYDYGIDGAYPYIVLPHRAQSLEDQLQAGEPFSTRRTLDIIRPIAEAVAFLHEQGFAHGDIKPSNIFFTTENTPQLSDTGLHKLLQDTAELLELDDIVGTPPYMAPEQRHTGKSSAASDVYGLAAVAYHCLTAQAPATTTPASPASLNADLKPEVDAVFTKALHEHASRRYQDTTQFIAALEIALFGETESAQAQGDQPKARPRPQRKPGWQLRRLGCGVALAIWGVLMLWPCVLITVLIEGEFVVGLSDRPGHEVRMFNVESEDARGFGFSVAEVERENADRLCIKTYVRYFIWRGDNAPVDYCRCYTRRVDNWQASRAVNAACEPLSTPQSLDAQFSEIPSYRLDRAYGFWYLSPSINH